MDKKPLILTLSIRLDEETNKKLLALAGSDERSRGAIVRRLIKNATTPEAENASEN